MINLADIFLFSGVLLFGVGLHLLLPAATPYFIVILGLALGVLGGLGIVRGRRK